jgi:hypothetical protein
MLQASAQQVPKSLTQVQNDFNWHHAGIQHVLVQTLSVSLVQVKHIVGMSWDLNEIQGMTAPMNTDAWRTAA